MALFGGLRDIHLFKTMNRELLEDIISQQIGYYKIKLSDTPVNMYGEAVNKYYIGPVLLNCLIERGDFASNRIDYSIEVNRTSVFRFFKDHLKDADVVPEIGDIVMFNEHYFEVDNVNENQLIVGKDNDYAYSEGLQSFGNSLSIILTTHYVSPDKLGINLNRL
jgi:hypothetical protein